MTFKDLLVTFAFKCPLPERHNICKNGVIASIFKKSVTGTVLWKLPSMNKFLNFMEGEEEYEIWSVDKGVQGVEEGGQVSGGEGDMTN